jgi:pyruvate dehydrogenase E1 component alpha subunit
MHIADFGVGMLGANGVVSANIPIGAGAAHGIKLLGDDRIVVDLFGDGAINRGPFLEGLNWAVVFGLPVLFVCEDNEWSATTRTADMTAGPGAAARARAIGLHTEEVDGNDAEAVADAAAGLVARVREARAPAFLHARTFRQGGHTYFDPAAYRPAAEAEARIAADDPIARQREVLAQAGVGAEEMDRLREAARAEMAAALDAARDAPFPEAATAFADVQDVGSPQERAV